MIHKKQIDERWSGVKLKGTKYSIGQIGCLITSISMFVKEDPNVLANKCDFVTSGTKEGAFYWASVSKAVEGTKWIGNKGKNQAEIKKSIDDTDKFCSIEIANGNNYGGMHWLAPFKYDSVGVYCLDPLRDGERLVSWDKITASGHFSTNQNQTIKKQDMNTEEFTTVKKGEGYWNIAQRIFGTDVANKTKELQALNNYAPLYTGNIIRIRPSQIETIIEKPAPVIVTPVEKKPEIIQEVEKVPVFEIGQPEPVDHVEEKSVDNTKDKVQTMPILTQQSKIGLNMQSRFAKLFIYSWNKDLEGRVKSGFFEAILGTVIIAIIGIAYSLEYIDWEIASWLVTTAIPAYQQAYAKQKRYSNK